MSRHRRWFPVRAAARYARAYTSAYENDESDPEFNGEFALLDRLRPVGMRVAIDVGAHHGRWAARVIDTFPEATVHAIEPAPESVTVLQSRFASSPAVVVHSVAFGAHSGRAELTFDSQHSDLASLRGGNGQRLDVELRLGDSFLNAMECDHVDFVKIDAEGSDLEVLKGLEGSLREGRIRVLQFELSPWNVLARTWLGDFFDFLEPCGYRIGRLFPTYAEFSPYNFRLETFQYLNNYVAVAQADREAFLLAQGRL